MGCARGSRSAAPVRVLAMSRQVLEIVERRGHRVLDEPVELRSGARSRHFVDGKRALARGDDLRVAATALLDLLGEAGVAFDAVGGLTMGADHLAHAMAVLAGDVEWFSVRKVSRTGPSSPTGTSTSRPWAEEKK